ncbi:Crp/Fnr family transcriptional regulator [Sandaracinobacteroides saxicola]|uniref:Cyclic nucleotide-binding domain-containing protein n=1 Tax=Sandaracinobacteroides saxicola TaxID=2759707 RepID=A0A7G5IE02_9SPHN|nr:cyclic nucleotide-binding domain-containing protein [Sandaracinobacteroides saxicola]QMW21594.1 cyclic nucleotide-binding domain-containing protein [Sandaracinobacteroides saxicola]
MNAIDLVGHFAFALGALSLAMRDMAWLRGVGIASGLVGLGYNFFAAATPLWPPILWGSVYLFINAWALARLLRERRPDDLAPEIARLKAETFPHMSLCEFRRLARDLRWIDAALGEVLAREGNRAHAVMVLTSGRVDVYAGTRLRGRLDPGSIIGEAALVADHPYAATLVAAGPVRLACWDAADLAHLFAASPATAIGFERAYLRLIPADAQVRRRSAPMPVPT